jgi:hypothetical protein
VLAAIARDVGKHCALGLGKEYFAKLTFRNLLFMAACRGSFEATKPLGGAMTPLVTWSLAKW